MTTPLILIGNQVIAREFSGEIIGRIRQYQFTHHNTVYLGSIAYWAYDDSISFTQMIPPEVPYKLDATEVPAKRSEGSLTDAEDAVNFADSAARVILSMFDIKVEGHIAEYYSCKSEII